MLGRYQIVSFKTKDDLVALFCLSAPGSKKEYIEAKPQIEFLHQYCTRAGIKTLIFETPYIDRHYSEDYNGYYVKCHSVYPKVCGRIHFFRDAITTREMNSFFENGLQALNFNSRAYCGFVVVKPLPQTVIGRTCLVPLPLLNGGKGSEFFLTRLGHEPNLFGVRLALSALPFQEQDHEVGACATTAMWTALYATAHIFDTPVLSPLQITKKAFGSRPLPGVSLPNDGLDADQMAAVFQNVGLEADQQSARLEIQLQTFAAAYLRANIPVVLIFDFALTGKRKELHGVALTGIGTMEGKIQPYPSGLQLRATRIQKFYAHDDGIGPYSEIDLKAGNRILTSWTENGKRQLAKPELLLVPLYHKIRVFYQDVLEAILFIDVIFEQLRAHNLLQLGERIEWDIFLTSAADYKKDLIQNPVAKKLRQTLLVQGFPHFFWRATAYVADNPVMELLVDATDLRQGQQLMTTIFHDDGLRVDVTKVLSSLSFSGPIPQLSETILATIRRAKSAVTPQ